VPNAQKVCGAYPYHILDARCERVREGGVIVRPAVLIAVALV
jgi:transposase-like protein